MNLLGFEITLFGVLTKVAEFFVIYVVLRTYIARDVTTEIDKRGLFKDGLVHTIIREVKNMRIRLPLIWKHYWNQHPAQNVLDCNNQACRAL